MLSCALRWQRWQAELVVPGLLAPVSPRQQPPLALLLELVVLGLGLGPVPLLALLQWVLVVQSAPVQPLQRVLALQLQLGLPLQLALALRHMEPTQ